MAIEIALTKSGCTIIGTMLNGVVIINHRKQVQFETIGEIILLRLGTDSDNRRFRLAPAEISVSAAVPANAAAFITAMGTLLQCGAGSAGTPPATTYPAWAEGIVGTTAGYTNGTNIFTPSFIVVAGSTFIVCMVIVNNAVGAHTLQTPGRDFSYNAATGETTLYNPDGSARNFVTGDYVSTLVLITPP